MLCHGAPGVDASEAGEGLNPPAPDLTLARIQKRTDGELFWILQNGIRMTGMPAFGPTHKDDELWKMVAFLRHLPQLTPEEEKALQTEEGSDHHAAEGSDHHAEEGSTDPAKGAAEPPKPTPHHHAKGTPAHHH